MPEPLAHIERSRPPWRTVRLTECGREVSQFAVVLSHEEAAAKMTKQGVQRASLTTCMTCLNEMRMMSRSGDIVPSRSWEVDPSGVIWRDTAKSASRRTDLLAKEMRALATLYERHEDEYNAIYNGNEECVDFGAEARKRGAR